MLKPGSLALTAMLGLLSGIGPLSTDMYLPSLPEIATVFGTTASQVQLTISSYLVGFAIGQMVYGPLSDVYGRKPVMLFALGLYVLATAACIASPSVEFLIVARGMQAVGGCGAIVLSRAIVRDLYSGARAGREMSIIAMVMGSAPIIAPLLGGMLHTWFGWQSTFVVLMLTGIGIIVLVVMTLPETLRRTGAERFSFVSIVRSYAIIGRDASFVAHALLVVFAYSGLFAWISVAAFVLQDLHGLSPFAFAVAFSCGSVGFIAGTTLASRLVMRAGLNTVMGFGALGLAAGGTCMALAVALHVDTPAVLVVSFAVYLVGLGLLLPQATAASLMPFPQRAGAASSLLGLVQQTAAAICGAVVGSHIGSSAWPLALALLITGWGAMLVWVTTRGIRAPAAER